MNGGMSEQSCLRFLLRLEIHSVLFNISFIFLVVGIEICHVNLHQSFDVNSFKNNKILSINSKSVLPLFQKYNL